MRFLILLFAALGVVFGAIDARTDDSLGIAVPYLPKVIDPTATNEPVTRIILANLSLALLQPSATGPKLGLASSVKTLPSGEWEAELPSDIMLSGGRPFTGDSAKEVFSYFLSLRPDDPAFTALSKVEVAQAPLDLERLLLRWKDEDYIAASDLLATLPLVDPLMAKTFGRDFGKGTLVSFVGCYTLKENKGSALILEASPNCPLPGLPASRRLEIKSFDTEAAALSSLRVGGVEIIAFGTEQLITSAATDPTLAVIDSPLQIMKPHSGEWDLIKDSWSEQADETKRLITAKIIVRKSLRLDERALSSFNLTGCYLP